MKKKNSRIFILALIAGLIFALTACSEDPAGGTGENGIVPGEAEGRQDEEEIDEGPVRPVLDLPDVDMEGRTFTFLTSNWGGEAVWSVTDILGAEELTGEALNDAIILRNLEIEQRFNCVIREVNFGGYGEANSALTRSVRAGTSEFDIIILRLLNYWGLAGQGNIIDMNLLEHVNFQNPWWDQNSVENLAIAGMIFAVCNDITTMDKQATSAIIFNKSLLADYGLDNPYEHVRNGTWTLDVLIEMSRAVATDLTGDGQMSPDTDRFGFMYIRDTLLSFLVGGGEKIARLDADGVPYITLHTEGAMTWLLTIMEFFYERDVTFNSMMLPGDYNVAMDAMFQNNQALFMGLRMGNVVALRTMPADFGILPMPKRSVEQEHYISDVNSWTGAALAIPATNVDFANTGIFIEAMAEASNRLVQPAYRDVLLDGIIARDEDSLEMLEIIFNYRQFDIGAIGRFGELRDVLWLLMDFNTNMASWVDARIERAERDIVQNIERIIERHR